MLRSGLTSTDVAKIKAARGTAKGQVTTNTTELRNALVVKDGKFLVNEIDENLVQELLQKLNKSYRIFQKLHYRYWDEEGYYDWESDDGSYFYVPEKETHYLDSVDNKVSLARISYVKYQEALAASIEDKKKIIENEEKTKDKKVEDSAQVLQLAPIADAIETSKKKLDGAMIAASTVTVKSSDENVRSTASPIKEELKQAFSSHESSKVAELKAATTLLKSNQAEEKHAPAKVHTAKKFGDSCPKIGDVIRQIKKMIQMKVVKTDEGFVEYVENLEKIQRDLSALNSIGEIANKATID